MLGYYGLSVQLSLYVLTFAVISYIAIGYLLPHAIKTSVFVCIIITFFLSNCIDFLMLHGSGEAFTLTLNHLIILALQIVICYFIANKISFAADDSFETQFAWQCCGMFVIFFLTPFLISVIIPLPINLIVW